MQHEKIMKAAGYAFNPKREDWFHRDQRKSFSYEALRDHDSRWLALKLDEHVPEGEFRFYRTTSNLALCMEILEELKLSHLTPIERLR